MTEDVKENIGYRYGLFLKGNSYYDIRKQYPVLSSHVETVALLVKKR